MITTELSNIQGLISSNSKLTAGMDFMRLMRTEGLLEASRGLFPAIVGGAVRDGLFTGREINDIDIFIFRDGRSPAAVQQLTNTRDLEQEMRDYRQNLLAWLEDMEIDSRSLLSDRAASYFGGQRFLDIIEFVWNSVTIQVMIPAGNTLQHGVDNLLRTMPIYSALAITQEYLRMFDTTAAHMWLPEGTYFVATERDVPYLRHKFPQGRALPVSNSREAAMLALTQYHRTVTLDEVNLNDTASMNVNSANSMCRRALAEKFNVPFEVLTNVTQAPTNTL